MDDDPDKKRKQVARSIAARVRMLGSPIDSLRRKAFAAWESLMREEGLNWSDIGNAIEDFLGGNVYSETDLQLFGQAQRAEGVEIGIKIGLARANGGGGNGWLRLPPPPEMAEFCHDRLGRLKDDSQRKFITEMFLITRRGVNPQRGSLGYLVSIYIKHGGRT